MSFIKKFNDHLDRFLVGIIEMYPDMTKITTYRATINLIKTANARQQVDGFIEFVLPYKNAIVAEDYQFFLNMNYNEDNGGNSETHTQAQIFKDIWKKNMSDESRKNIFKHLKLLCMLADKCQN